MLCARNRRLLPLLMEICSEAQGNGVRSMAWPPHAGSKAIWTPLLPRCHHEPASIMVIQIQTYSHSAVVSNSHFPLVKIEMGLSFLPSQGDEERRCRGIRLKHSAHICSDG